MELNISMEYIHQYSYSCKKKKFTLNDVLDALVVKDIDKGSILKLYYMGYHLKCVVLGYTEDMRLLVIPYDKYNQLIKEEDLIELEFEEDIKVKNGEVILRNLIIKYELQDEKEDINKLDKYLLKCKLLDSKIPNTYSKLELEEEVNKDTYVYNSLYLTIVEKLFIVSFILIIGLGIYFYA